MIFGELGEDPAGRPRALHARSRVWSSWAGQRPPWEGLLPDCTVWGCRRPRGRNPENAAVPEALVKLFPDSSEAENPQASAFPDCQGHGSRPLGSRPLPPPSGRLSRRAQREARPDLTRSGVPSTPGPAEGVGRLDTPQGLGSGFPAFWTPLAGASQLSLLSGRLQSVEEGEGLAYCINVFKMVR
ncbi:hypothetical protein VULLAG_LOCUS10114 [Vulpes lagopus]